MLTGVVVEARGLVGVEKGLFQKRKLTSFAHPGTSDPFCKIVFGKEKFKTSTIKKTTDPKWNENFQLYVGKLSTGED